MYFNTKLIRNGDKYGLNDCLTHDQEEAMIEFYDADYISKDFTPSGQFVSRYYVSTLLQHDIRRGLSLYCGVPKWTIEARELQHVISALANI